jgi:hypothetical protein
MNIALSSSSLGIIHSNIVSLKSIASSSTINAGSFSIFNSFFILSSLVISTSINEFNHNSSKAELTLLNNSFVFSSVQYNLIFIF